MIWFEWDTEELKQNWRDHRVRFEDAQLVFFDPHAYSDQDRVENGEERWQTVGIAKDHLLLCVAHTVRDGDSNIEIIRIISARDANPAERRRYGNRKI